MPPVALLGYGRDSLVCLGLREPFFDKVGDWKHVLLVGHEGRAEGFA